MSDTKPTILAITKKRAAALALIELRAALQTPDRKARVIAIREFLIRKHSRPRP
jgi:hypothetical protein